ncbi:18135_t:CDS:2, partial [Gigaspora rosea]
MYLTLLVAIDNNTKSQLVAQCLSDDKTSESYEWFFDCILQATNNVPPNSLFENNFHYRWIHLLKKYPQACNYLNNALQNCYKAWAKCFQPIFPEILELLKEYLPPHILSVQCQQILGSLYRARLISKEMVSTIEENSDQLDCNNDFFEDCLDRPQTTLYSLMDGIQPLTQLKQVDNNSTIVPDLHIFNQLRTLYAYTTETGQHIQKKVKYAYGFGKMKAALNLALDMSCEDELVDMISGFIDQKKNSLNNENDKNYKDLHVLKSNHDKNTAVRTPLDALNSNSNEIDSGISAKTSQGMKENTTKR